jgi:hypothetical protein
MMANPDIGLIVCPCCDFPGAHVRQTAKGRAYIVCDDCASQTFARGSVSDASIRRRMTPAAVQPDPAPDDPPASKPAKRKTAAPAPAPTQPHKPETDDFKSWLTL